MRLTARINTAKCTPYGERYSLPRNTFFRFPRFRRSESRVGCLLLLVETLVKQGHDRDLVLAKSQNLFAVLNTVDIYSRVLNVEKIIRAHSE